MFGFKKHIGSQGDLRCSFCNKSQEKVEKLISSPGKMPRAYICNECVALCYSILEEAKKMKTSK